jgi:hypothetical protein
MLVFDASKLQEGDLLKVRSETDFGKLIRVAVSSYSNHDAMLVQKDGNMFIAEAVEPHSRLTTLQEYEHDIAAGKCTVRVYRLREIDTPERITMARYFVSKLIGLKYPKKWKMVILASRLINHLDCIPFKMHLTWCSQLVATAIMAVRDNAIDGPGGKRKQLWTPKTFENRILQGLFTDITDTVLVEKNLDSV